MEQLLKEPERVKECARDIVQRYIESHQKCQGTEDLLNSLQLVPHGPNHGTITPYVPPDAEEELDLVAYGADEQKAEENFIATLKCFEASATEKYKTGIDMDQIHTMQQLWDAIDEIVVKYKNEKLEGVWGKIRLAFRKLGENSKAMESWLGLVPKESKYLSVVCGGLVFIIKIAARMKELRESIYDALEEIPLILNGAQRVLVIHETSQRLQNFSSSLYVSILEALGHMVSYLQRQVRKKIFGPIIRNSDFEIELTKKIELIRKCKDAFNYEAQTCQREMIKKIAEWSKGTNMNTQYLNQQMEAIGRFLFIAQIENERIMAALHEKSQREREQDFLDLKRRQSELRQNFESQKKSIDDQTNKMNELLGIFRDRFLTENPKTIGAANAIRRPLDSGPSQPYSSNRSVSRAVKNTVKHAIAIKPSRARSTLLSRLSYDKSASQSDLAANYNIAPYLSREDQERVLYVARSTELASWLSDTSTSSAVLLINGNCKRILRRSPLSFVCAKLVYHLQEIRAMKHRVVPLHYFCAENNSDCADIANTLLAQLLLQCENTDLAEVVEMGGFDYEDMKAVFKRFQKVLELMSKDTIVFCIIDGLSGYQDDSETRDDTEKLLKWLVRLRSKANCLFKFFVTAPNQMHGSTAEWMKELDMVLDVPKLIPGPKGGGFTERKWAAAVGRQAKRSD